MLNVEEIYQGIEELHGYKDNGKIYTFYYDETNNYRKVRITNNGLNDFKVLMNNFTLGGICFEKNKKKNVDELIEDLKLQKGQELKSKTFFKGLNSFEQCISHNKINIILDWILENAYIHYSDVDSLYFSIIDIVDSFCENDINKYLPQDLTNAFKDELYDLIKRNIVYFLTICQKVNYPNVTGKNIKIFCDSLIYMINNENSKEYYTLEFFKELIEMQKNSPRLIFLQGNEEKTIMNSFYSLRQQRCIIFKNSEHVFDKELIDEQKMKKERMLLKSGERLNNYKFIDSKEEDNVQISDIVIYLISKYLKFLSYNTVENIENTINNLNMIGRENLIKLIKNIDKSNYENPFFIETINPQRINLNRYLMNEYIESLLKYNKE